MSEEKKKKPEKKKAPEKKEETAQKGVLGVSTPSLDEVTDFLKGVKVVTPSLFAERFKTRVSVAKSILRDLVSKGLLREVVGVNRIRVYEPLVKVQATASGPKVVEAEVKPKKAKKSSKQTASETQP
ncbi:MAG: hypothetical protein QXU87_00935 [Candidatus Caldarchaeum sp.]